MKLVLFACVHNAGRSQMAAALFNRRVQHGAARALSAGTQPATHVHPVVVDAMSELGIDLREARPELLSAALARDAALLVTMGCGEAAPLCRGCSTRTGRSWTPRVNPSREFERSATRFKSAAIACSPAKTGALRRRRRNSRRMPLRHALQRSRKPRRQTDRVVEPILVPGRARRAPVLPQRVGASRRPSLKSPLGGSVPPADGGAAAADPGPQPLRLPRSEAAGSGRIRNGDDPRSAARGKPEPGRAKARTRGGLRAEDRRSSRPIARKTHGARAELRSRSDC
jgi:protein-tyrosine-phosphatase